MKYSLVTRDLIADSTEALAMAHQFDGLVMIPNCDKNVPGLLMAAARGQYPDDLCERRSYACRSCKGWAYQSFQYVRGGRRACGRKDLG